MDPQYEDDAIEWSGKHCSVEKKKVGIDFLFKRTGFEPWLTQIDYQAAWNNNPWSAHMQVTRRDPSKRKEKGGGEQRCQH